MTNKLGDYAFVMAYTTTAPLAHGSGVEGNEQVLARETINVVIGGSYEQLEVPRVSAAAFKASIRECAVEDFLESSGLAKPEELAALAAQAGAKPEAFTKALMRLLLKGGEVTGGSQSVNLGVQARIREMLPPVSLFGAMHGGMTIPGRFVMNAHVRPYCRELVDAGLIPSRVERAARLTVDGVIEATQGPAETVALFDGTEPIPLGFCTTIEQNYKHDLADTALGQRMLGAKAVAEIADQREAVSTAKGAKGKGAKPSADERRSANESMPYSRQVMPAGTPLIAQFRLEQATQMELIALLRALYRWAQKGARLGGGSGAGMGGWGSVRIHGAWSMEYMSGALPADAALVPDVAAATDKLLGTYDEHIAANAATIRSTIVDVLR